MSDDRLPTYLWVDAHLRILNRDGVPYYIANTGERMSGTVLLKLSNMSGQCRVLQQQRNIDGEMGWMVMLGGDEETVVESEADNYIRRAIDRDPDLWVIEVEDKNMANPFEGKVF